MTLLFSVLCLFIYTSVFLFAFKVIVMPYRCYSQFLMNLFCKKNGVLFSLKKRDLGRIGFMDDIGGGVNGLMSCTESIGFESCDERRVDGVDDHRKDMEICDDDDDGMMVMMMARDDACRRKRIEEKIRERNNKKFPPPLSSLNQNGQPCFYLKPVRENGRLELTEVRIQRREILHAVRQNGRLRLHLVSNDVCSKINEEQELHLKEVKEEEEEKEETEVEELCNYGMSGKGFGRCHEVVMSHHHPNINDHHRFHICMYGGSHV